VLLWPPTVMAARSNTNVVVFVLNSSLPLWYCWQGIQWTWDSDLWGLQSLGDHQRIKIRPRIALMPL